MNKDGVEQMIVIVDLKGTKLKDLSNKQVSFSSSSLLQVTVIFKSLLVEFQRFYPEMLESCFIVNTPMFFDGIWESEIKPNLSAKTISRIHITGENTHKLL